MISHQPFPKSVNLHLTGNCNYRCKYCHSQFKDAIRRPDRDVAIALLRALAEEPKTQNCKITFVGGEPTLLPWLGDVIAFARECGFTTMLVTNGHRLTDDVYLSEICTDLDWLGLSVDSAEHQTNLSNGRAERGRTLRPEDIIRMTDRARGLVSLKVNTVVTRHNLREDLREVINRILPSRWKIMQVMRVADQNDTEFGSLAVEEDEFGSYVERNRAGLCPEIEVAEEPARLMRGSYAMIDPQGRFFDSVSGKQEYSDPIADVGLLSAWNQVSFSMEKFQDRGGYYDYDVRIPRILAGSSREEQSNG